MGHFAKYLRRKANGGKNVITDKSEKKKFAEEIRQMFDPVEREKQRVDELERLVLQSAREPTITEVLEQVALQAGKLNALKPDAPLVCFCGAYAFALLSNVGAYPFRGMKSIVVDKRVPPWDVVVMFEHHRSKVTKGIV